MVSYELALSRLSYNPETGVLRWKKNNRIAGHRGRKYIEVRVGEEFVYGHRLAWLLHYGEYPPVDHVIDHVNRDGHDNRISNLRAVPQRVNCLNAFRGKEVGISYCKQTGRWKAYLTNNYKRVWLGRFPTKEAALQARIAAEERLYPVMVPREQDLHTFSRDLYAGGKP